MEFKDLAKMGVTELREEELRLRKQAMTYRFEHALGKLLNTAAPKKVRKDLARVLTRQSQLAAEQKS